MYRKLVFFVTILTFLLLVAGCGNSEAPTSRGEPIVQLTSVPMTAEDIAKLPTVPPPDAAAASVTGVVIRDATGEPVKEVPVRLAEVYREDPNAGAVSEDGGAFVLDDAHSPYAETDANGQFTFANVPPHEYVLVIGNVGINRYVIIQEPTGKPKVWSATAGNVLNVGELRVAEIEGFTYAQETAPSNGYPAPQQAPEPTAYPSP